VAASARQPSWSSTPKTAKYGQARSRDFADRPPDNVDLLGALESLGQPPLAPPAASEPAVERVEALGALRPETFGPMSRGIRFATLGLAGRLETEVDRVEARRMSAMAQTFLDAWKERRAAGS
jgi:hypothetical protein